MRDDMNDEQNDGSFKAHVLVGCCKRRRCPGQAILGIAAILLGVLWTLDNINLIDAGSYWQYWPVLLIVVGLSHLLTTAASRRIGAGLIWLSVGSVLLLHNLEYISFNVWDLWPLALVIGGGSIVYNSLRTKRRKQSGESSNQFDATAVLGGATRKISSDNFVGGQATAMMGGCEVDLRDATITESPAEIHVTALMGGIEIRVPQEWEVQVKGSAILGGFEDNTSRIGDGSQVLVITGTAVLGGVEIKN